MAIQTYNPSAQEPKAEGLLALQQPRLNIKKPEWVTQRS